MLHLRNFSLKSILVIVMFCPTVTPPIFNCILFKFAPHNHATCSHFIVLVHSFHLSQSIRTSCALFMMIAELHGPVGQIVSSERGVLAVEQHKVLITPAYQRSLAWGFADLSCHISQYESDKVCHLTLLTFLLSLMPTKYYIV